MRIVMLGAPGEKERRRRRLRQNMEFPIFPQEIFSERILRTEPSLEKRRNLIWIRECWFPMS